MTPKLADGLAVLARRAQLAQWFIGAVIVVTAGFAIILALALNDLVPLFDIPVEAIDYSLADFGMSLTQIVLAASFVFVGMWIVQAHRNLRLANLPHLEFTPGWAVGWYAVPIANLFKPFRAMRELWNASHGATDTYQASEPWFLWAWWLAWLGATVNAFSGSEYNAFDVAALTCDVISALGILHIVREVTRAQHTLDVAGAFA